MLWKSLRWNWVNTWAIAAFCLLPFIGLASGNFGHGKTVASVSVSYTHLDVYKRQEQHRLRKQCAEQNRTQPVVMRLTGREGEIDRQAIGVHHRVNLAGQATS